MARDLVVGLGEGEAGAELLPGALVGGEQRRFAQRRSAATRISSPAMSRMRCFMRAFRVCQPAPPSLSSAMPPPSEPKRDRSSMFSTGR